MDIVAKLRQACKGHPHAKIAWPHRLLHEAADTIKALKQRIADLERSEAATQKLYQSWHDRALKAEHLMAQLSHALKAVREDLEISAEYGEIKDISPETIERIEALHQEPGESGE